MIDQHLPTAHKKIGRNKIPDTNMDPVTGNDKLRRQHFPPSVTEDPALNLQMFLQQGKSFLSATFLIKSKEGVENQEKDDNAGLDLFMENHFEHESDCKQRGNRPEKFSEKKYCRIWQGNGDFVWAVTAQAMSGFFR